MSVPNHEGVVRQVYNAGTYNLRNHADCGRFTEDVCRALHALDRRFGHLRKRPPANHVIDAHGRAHAVDAVLYLSDVPGQSRSVDIIFASASTDANEVPRPIWDVDIPRYSASDWYAPDGSPAPAPVPTPNPEPPATDIPRALQQIAEMHAILKRIEAKFL